MLRLPEETDEALKLWANLVAASVRHSMEAFHVDHLSDAQMKELNPIIRNAIYQALRSLWFLKWGSEEAQVFANYDVTQLICKIESYWEEPKLPAAAKRIEEEHLKDPSRSDPDNIIMFEDQKKRLARFKELNAIDLFGPTTE